MKLYVCWGTFPTLRPGGHPCRNAYRALRDGRIFAAGLDVFEREPEVHPDLLGLDNVVLAPHIAIGSVRTRSEMSVLAVRNLLAGLHGERPPNLLNPEVVGG